MTDEPAPGQLAYFYPEPYWRALESGGLKTLLLFFDGIATLLPQYMRGREVSADPFLAGPLTDLGLLKILEPENFIDQRMAEELSSLIVDLIASGAFDGLPTAHNFAELSHSRLGWNADIQLARMLVDELEARGLAWPSSDGVSVPLHPVVRTTILVLLAQLARGAGRRQGLDLHPTTGQTKPICDMVSTLSREPMPSVGHVVALDLEMVSVDLETVPLDEILSFRQEHGDEYRAYARDLRRLVIELGAVPESERAQLLTARQGELSDRAADLRRRGRDAWRLPFTSFSLGAAGAAWEVVGNHDRISALLALASGVAGAATLGSESTAGAYSYLFVAQSVFEGR